MHEESCSDILYFLKVGVTSKHVAILSMSLKGVSAADESTSLQTLCACNRVFLYIFTCLDVLCSCSILLLSWASFQTRVLILPWASFQTRVLKIGGGPMEESQETHSSFTNTCSNKIQEGATSKPNCRFRLILAVVIVQN